MTQYAGEDESFPESITLPDPNAPPTAAAFNPALQAIADRTAWLKARGLRPSACGAVGTSIGDLRSAVYDATNHRWYFVGGNENVRSTKDLGLSWDSDDVEHVAAVGAGEHCYSIDVDSVGNVVVATDARYVFEKTARTVAWTKVDAYGDETDELAPPEGRVSYDPIRDRWIWAKSLPIAIRTSIDRTTWTSSSFPFAWETTWPVIDMACNKRSGRTLIATTGFSGTQDQVFIATSDDGGVTWTDRNDVVNGYSALAGFPIERICLSHVPGPWGANREWLPKGAWFLVLGRETGGYQSEVWKSIDDGVTWAQVSSISTVQLTRVAAVLGLLYSIAVYVRPDAVVDCQLAESTDGGATWRPTCMGVDGPARGVFDAGNSLAIVTASKVYFGPLIGAPNLDRPLT
jgi:hypothetical protein